MKGKFFLDTNILVYALDSTFGKKSEVSFNLVRHAIQTKRGVISYQVVQEYFNVAFKQFAKPLPLSEADNYLRTVFRPLLAVQSSSLLFADALRIKIHHQFSWYDALIASAALQAGCEVLYTEDLQNGRILEALRIENPLAGIEN
ncbi:MAG TPA: PIN domain-containing protein [Terriglobales bacterium]|nr:PIN domain-containing protein [Terriglobales bacterium]